MTNLAALCCCELGCPGCVHSPCRDSSTSSRYPTIGRPVFNTNPQHYAGVLWPAWWNAIARHATLDVDISFTLTPPIGAEISFRITGVLGLAGMNGNQTPGIYEDAWGVYPSMPCGPWPYGIVLCGFGPAGADDPIPAGADPIWWPYRNRYLVPRWRGALKLEVGDTITLRTVSVDYPIAVCGNHTTCSRLQWEYGATEGAWGFDLCIPDIVDEIALLLPADKIGSLTRAWCGITQDCITESCDFTSTKLRILRGLTQDIPPDKVLPFGVTRTIVRSGTEIIGGDTWGYSVDATLIPNDWCVLDDACGCAQSYCEHGAAILSANVTIPLDPQCGALGGATTLITLALEAHNDSLTFLWENTGGYLGSRPFEAAMPAAGHVGTPYRNRWNWGLNYDGYSLGRGYWKMPAPVAEVLWVAPPGCPVQGFGGGCTPVTRVNVNDYFCCFIGDDDGIPNQHGRCGEFKLNFGCAALYEVTVCSNPPLALHLYVTPCDPQFWYWNAYRECSPTVGSSYTLYCSGQSTTGTVIPS